MANRRMFSLRIINSASFLKLPLEAQALYFHLAMRADDDGVVEAYPVLKILETKPDSFSLLFMKNFIYRLNDDLVCLIQDWNEHNVIRADRKVDSKYIHLLREIPNLEILEARPRSDVEDNSYRLGGQSTDGIGKVRLGKDNKKEEILKLKKEIKERLSYKEEV